MGAIGKSNRVFLIEKSDKEKAMNLWKTTEKCTKKAMIAPKSGAEKGDEKKNLCSTS